MPLFDLGFGPDQPSPQELSQVDSQVAIAKGTRDGLAKVATSAADALMAEPMKLADQMIGSVIEPANDAIGSASSVADNISAYGHAIALNAIQGPLAQGLAWGYQSKGTPLLLPQETPSRGKRRKGGGKTGASPPPILPFDLGIRAGGPTGTGPSGGTATVPPVPGGGGGTGYGTGAPPFPAPPGFDGGGMPLPVQPGGGNLLPVFPGGGGIFQTQPGLGAPNAGPPGPGAGGIPGIPQPQPQPPQQCCPPGQINVNQAPPAINITMPAQIITTGPDGLPTGSIIVQPVVVPPPTINVSPTPIDVSLSCPGGQTTPTQPGPAGSGTLSTSPGGGAVCPSCSIPYLSLKYPQFVIAERAAQKTDYDILVDAITLKLCCGNVDQPGCSMPFLERMVPEFVRAAKAQGIEDDIVLQQAVNIGLCKDEPVSTGLGEENVGYIAPGSAAALASEFDPSAAGEAWNAFLQNGLRGMPARNATPSKAGEGVAPLDLSKVADEFKCLGGLAVPLAQLMNAVSQFLKENCAVTEDSLAATMYEEAKRLYEGQTAWGKPLGTSLWWLERALNWVSCGILWVSEQLGRGTDCKAEWIVAGVAAQSVLNFVHKYAFNIPEIVQEGLAQVVNTGCQYKQLTSAEADSLRARSLIGANEWECIVKANGDQVEQHGNLVVSAYATPNDQEILTRQRWIKAALETGTIDGKPLAPEEIPALEDELKLLAKMTLWNGWGDPQRYLEWYNAQVWTPATSDAVEWMLKDVDDPQVVDTFLLGAEFTQKYGKSVKAAFIKNGVTEGNALNIWKSHWRSVSPELLYHMHKRLRPGWTALMTDAEVTSYVEAICPVAGANVTPDILAGRPISNGFPVPTYCNEIPDAATGRKYLESITVTGYHASEALGHDDYPAFWRPRMLALSYNVLTRVDARRAYEIGLFTDKKLISVYMDQGYKESDAAALTAFAHKQLVLKFSRSPTAKEWIQFPYQTDLLYQNLLGDGMRFDLFPEVLKILEGKLVVKNKVRQLKEARKQVLGGRINRADAVKKVAAVLGG